MKKPKNWHGFKIFCELYDVGQSNMSPPSHQEYCSRKDRKGKSRPRWEGDIYLGLLRCHWNICPKLKRIKVMHNSEIKFIENFFTHKNWIYHPVIFRLNGVNYEPDFYDGERNVFIEVSGTRQAFQANFDKYKLFIKTFPHIKFEVRDIYGKIKPLTKRNYVRKQDSAKNQ